MRPSLLLCLFWVLTGCNPPQEMSNQDLGPTPPGLLPSLDASPPGPDIYIIEHIVPDAYIDPCLEVSSSSDLFCQCQPQCCQTQMWYCPPNGLGVTASEVIMNICDEAFGICDRSEDLTCAPNEILTRSDCRTILECPPGIDHNITITVRCEIEGTEGEQEIRCRKGEIEYGECIICDPREERCNFQDDDCDGVVDEGQLNICGTCGPVPSDTCDGMDNDCDELIDEELVRECETACGPGLETCDAGNWISCTARQPSEEECDGEDNDCDARIDEQLDCLCTVDDVGNLMPCSEPPLICGQGFKTCECVDPGCTEMRLTDCAALCHYLQIPEPPICDPTRGLILEEECNNFDDDCDTQVDEELIQPCYTGAPDTLFVGVCQPGEAYCSNGIWGHDRNDAFNPGFCLGEVTPQEEICNGADDDCDGIVDYGEEIRETDILFIVDWSGSMDDEIEAVKVALNRFATHFAAEEPLQWGLIIGPKQFVEGGDETLVLVSDIAPFDQFLGAFAALGNEGMDTGSEMLLDAVYLAIRNISPVANLDIASTVWWRNTGSTPEKENFVISWRPDSNRIVIIFSDEEEQTFLRDVNDPEGPARPITREIVEDASRAGINLKVHAFASGGGFGNVPNNWEDLTLAGRGHLFDLTSNAVSMYNNLMSIIDEACLPMEEELPQMGSSHSHVPGYRLASWAPRYDLKNRVCY